MFSSFQRATTKSNYLTCLSFLLLLTCSSSLVEAIVFDEVSALHVWITISSLANKDPNNAKSLIFRQVELNWINAPLEDENDYIGLYLDSQPDDDILPVSVHRLNGQPSGQIITDHYLPTIDFYNLTMTADSGADDDELSSAEPATFKQQFPELSDESHQGALNSGSTRLRRSGGFVGNDYDHQGQRGFFDGPEQRTQPTIKQANKQSILLDECVGYCLAYHSRNRILAKNCLKTNPTWMRDSFHFIGSRTLPSLMIPGTHNSGTYPKHLDKSVLHMISKYQMNQDESIFNQLVYGVRHLDLRVGYTKVKQRPERLWIYHDIFRTEVSVNEVFEQVRKFLELTTNEIIIMDFHRFTVGFQNENMPIQRERHSKLIDLIFEKLSKFIVPSYLGQNVPIESYVALGKRLIIGYANRASIIPAGQAENLNTMFARLHNQSDQLAKQQQQQQPKQQVSRDSIGSGSGNDEAKKDIGDRTQNESMTIFDSSKGSNGDLQARSSEEEQQEQERTERRSVGTRLFDKIKSLKVVSKSFSKRSIRESMKPISGKPSFSSTSSFPLEKLISSSNGDIEGGNANSNVATDFASSVSRAALFFGPVRHLWPNKDTIEGLAQYMNETTCRKYFGELRSMMAELTPTVFGVIADKYDGNRKLSQQINRPITDWIRDRWLHCINIVASDYFLGNDLVRLAIYANRVRTSRSNFDLNLSGQCKSFRRVEHLLDKSKIPIQIAYHHEQYPSDDESMDFGASSPRRSNDSSDIIMHTSSDGNQILLKPLSSSFNSFQAHSTTREKRDSFVENVSDGFSNLFSSFKKLLNL